MHLAFRNRQRKKVFFSYEQYIRDIMNPKSMPINFDKIYLYFALLISTKSHINKP